MARKVIGKRAVNACYKVIYVMPYEATDPHPSGEIRICRK
jgi:hypothetical protein